jgi:chromosome partitioning protein
MAITREDMVSEPNRPTRVIAVGNQKGGVGKTTNTVHIATALGEMGRRCLVWDLDMNYGTTRHFGIPGDAFLGTFEVLMGDELAENVIIGEDDADVKLPTNVNVIPSRRKLEQIDDALSSKNKFIVRQHVLLEPLRLLRGKYDYIFLDTAPNATTPTVAAYAAAEWFLLSAMPDPFAVAGLKDALEDIDSARRHGNERLRVLGVILSGVARNTRLGSVLTEYVEKAFTLPSGYCLKFKTEIGRSIVIPEAQKQGQTVFQTEPRHKVTEAYRELAREIEKRFTALEEEQSEVAAAK